MGMWMNKEKLKNSSYILSSEAKYDEAKFSAVTSEIFFILSAGTIGFFLAGGFKFAGSTPAQEIFLGAWSASMSGIAGIASLLDSKRNLKIAEERKKEELELEEVKTR